MRKTGDDKIQDIILQNLSKLNENQSKLSDAIQKEREELIRVSGLKHAISDIRVWQTEIKKWKDDWAEVISIEDFKNLKEQVASFEDFKIKINNIIKISSWVMGTAIALGGVLAVFIHK